MKIHLNSAEARVIGCLIEKEVTTPEQYPLSLNALTNACNQKSNREPVMQLDEGEVQRALDELVKKGLVVEKSVFGSRVAKYKHRFCNSEFGELRFSERELGVICVLLLRGPQTPGELRTRTNRLCSFADVQEVEAVLQELMARDDGPFVVRLQREPGKRESRYAHLFCGEVQEADSPRSAAIPQIPSDTDRERISQLEEAVGELRAEIEQLKDSIEQLTR